MSVAFVIIAFILIVASFVYYGFRFKQIYKDQTNFNFKDNKKSLIHLGISILLGILGFVFINLAFFNDNEVITRLNDASITVKGIHLAEIYIGFSLMVMFFFLLLTSLILLLYFTELDKKTRLILKIIFGVSVVGIIGFFLMGMEGYADYLEYPLANQILFSKNGIQLVFNNGKASVEGFHFSIAFYAIFIIGGATLVLYICDYMLYRESGSHGLLTSVFFIAFPSGIIGARIWYVVGEWSKYANKSFLDIIAIWDGGLAIMGGAVFGIIVGVTYVLIIRIFNPRYKKLDYFKMVDMIVPCILVAQAIGRTGNFFNVEVHGNPMPLESWAFLPRFIANNSVYSSAAPTLTDGTIYAPLWLVEAIVNWFGYFFIEFGVRYGFGLYHAFKKDDWHPEGSLAGWYIAWYGATRAIMEPMRYEKYNMGDNGQWSVKSAYWMIGIGSFIILVFIVLKILNKKGITKYTWQKVAEEEELNKQKI